MKPISKLKDDARKHELREEWEKAVQVYLQVLKIGEQGEGEVELPLYNRVGDLYVRLGRPLDAVRYYEQAADRYADAGLYNNAIALCNKAMRYHPHQLGLLRKLGMFSAQQGFYADARRYFLEYADKQTAHGKVDDALSALMDFARVADDADARELLGQRLFARGRVAEAVAELRIAYGMRLRAGQTEQADALRREIRAMDPSARFEEDREQTRPPPAGSYDADVTGLSHFDASPFDRSDVDRSVQLEKSDGTEYGLVDIDGFDDIEEAGSQGGGVFEQLDFERTDSREVEGFFDSTTGAGDDGFDLPLLADSDMESSTPRDFGVTGPGVSDPSAQTGSALAEFDDFDVSYDLPLLDENVASPFGANPAADLAEAETPPSEWLNDPSSLERDAGYDDFFGLNASSAEASSDTTGAFAGWPEDLDVDTGAPTGPNEITPSFGGPLPRPSAEDALHDMDMDDYTAWDMSSSVEEMALEAAAATERALREAEEFERREAEARATAAREAEARAAAAREAEAREAAAREATIREAEAREAAARAAAREADARAEARAAAEREAEMRAAREAQAPAPPRDPRTAGRWTPPQGSTAPPHPGGPARPTTTSPTAPRDDRYIDLGALFADEQPETTRFRIQESLPTGDDDRDFEELLGRFKEKVAEHLPPEDAAAHYDLGLAFKEMGLLDEAIAEFQVALRAGHMRLKVYEELGYCFLHKQQYNIAEKVLRQALQLEHRHELELLGIYYQLGRAYEAMGRLEQARDAYERVLGMDLHFQDTSERLARL